jgi:hypothetical protein
MTVFVLVAVGCLGTCVLALLTGRIIGVAFRSRFIARREHEPGLYWASIAVFAFFGGIAALCVAQAVLSG